MPRVEEREEEAEAAKPTPGLVSRGGRSPGIPRARQATPDDLIRGARRDRSVWTRIF
jgi:hypothetical protein